jgi:TetR/AcrR family transcriptional regulator, cholesterol catabolism regulator
MTNAASVPSADSRFSRRRAAIIKSAAHVFGRKGFHATTLEEIAAELQVTKASLYYYFSTKEELLYEVHLLSLQDVLGRVERIRAASDSPVVQLEAAITEHLRVLAGDYEGAFLLQQEYDLPEEYRQEIVKLRDKYEKTLLEIVQEGERQRLFRVKDARVAVRMLLGAINWFLRWYRASGRLAVDEIAAAYVDVVFYGMLAPPTAVIETEGRSARGTATSSSTTGETTAHKRSPKRQSTKAR